MKKVFYLVVVLGVVLFSCKKEDKPIPTYEAVVQLVYPSGGEFTAKEGVTVKISSSGVSLESATDVNGKASFKVPVGNYDVSATDTRTVGVQTYILNGLKTGIAVTGAWTGEVINLNLTASKTSQVIIKEVFVGGTPRDDGSGHFAFDKYVVLYNNSNTAADISKLCLGMVAPFNSNATNNYYNAAGELSYQSEGWIPAVQAFWYFQTNVTLAAGQEIVIALNNAVNNTLVHSKSINFDNANYYCTYDIANFNSASYYVAPSASIPSSHYLKCYKYATATAWALSVTTPGFFIFEPKNTTAAAFAADASSTHVLNAAYTSKKVPFDWVVDALEGYLQSNTANKKRYPAQIDAGYVYHNNSYGYSIYRNVDKAATEAITANAGKLVYNYSLGTASITDGSTDPSGIDAQASIKNGARIVFSDKNNSTLDYHLRQKAALSNY